MAGVVVLLAGGTATVTVNSIHKQRDYPWQVPGFNGGVLNEAPPQLAILPSKLSSGAWGNMRTKMMGTGVPAQTVVEAAYSDRSRGSLQTVVMTELPRGRFDYIASLPTGNAEGLREEVKRKFGVVARNETRPTNVLVLTLKNANAPALKPGTSPGGSSSTSLGEYSSVNQPLSSLAGFLSGTLKTPVIDRTGDARPCDIHLKWDATDWQHPNLDALTQALLEQLGLELVPATEPIAMLIIEKAK